MTNPKTLTTEDKHALICSMTGLLHATVLHRLVPPEQRLARLLTGLGVSLITAGINDWQRDRQTRAKEQRPGVLPTWVQPS